MTHLLYFFIFMGCFGFSIFCTKFLVSYLGKKQVVDVPNSRSNHKKPTPRGGGVAICAAILIGFVALCFMQKGDFLYLWPLFAAAILIAVISWVDDVKKIGIKVRFLFHIIAVSIGMVIVSDYGHIDSVISFGLLPTWLDYLITAILWLWFINLYNFMDGIDGITGTETVFIGLGIAISIFLINSPFNPAFYAAVIVAAALGFLAFNWHPAKIFMGDVGSITLGFLLGWLLLDLFTRGAFVAALIIPAYYLCDATVTITKRLIQRKKIWQAHSEHFYQQAVRRGFSHSKTVSLIICLNTILIALSIASIIFSGSEIYFLLMAYLLCFTFLYFLADKNEKFAE